ncbi:MAG TPA: hypothetical protein VGZ71_00150 [Puia sp.]|nr:hypothetical protein [Puia sp.]
MTPEKKTKKLTRITEVDPVIVNDPINQIIGVLMPSEAIKEEPLSEKSLKKKKGERKK